MFTNIPTDQLAQYMKRLKYGIEYLPQEYKKVWELHHVLGLSEKDISEMLGVKIETIKRIISESDELIRLY